MYIKRFVKHYYIMLIPIAVAVLFSIVPMFWNCYGFSGLQSGTGHSPLKVCWSG